MTLPPKTFYTAPASQVLDKVAHDLSQQVRNLEYDSRILGEMMATLRVNFGKDVGRVAKVLDPNEKRPLHALITVLEYLVEEAGLGCTE